MPGVSRGFRDTAGSTIIAAGNSSVRVNGSPVSVAFDPVKGHGDGRHGGPNMIQFSTTVRASGLGVVRQGDSASCGHPATGSSNVFCGG